MTGDRALHLLVGYFRGDALPATVAELEELASWGFLVLLDRARLARVRWYAAVRRLPRRTVDQVAAALRETEERLQSTFFRMSSFAATVRAEEERRAVLRSLLGVMTDPVEGPLLEATWTALAEVPPAAPWYPVDDGREAAVTHSGSRARFALEIRLHRFADRPLAEFAKGFAKAERRMEAVGAACGELRTQLATAVPRDVDGAVIGLLKTSLPPKQAAARFRESLALVPDQGMPVERPHLAVAVARLTQEDNVRHAGRRLQRAITSLVNAGFPRTPVVRGMARIIAEMPDPDAAAWRARELWSGLGAVYGDEALKVAARLTSAAGEVEEVLGRFFRALEVLSQPRAAAALAAAATDATHLEDLIQRWSELSALLVERRAFPRRAPPEAVELVALPGTPLEVVELVRQLVSHLPAHEHEERWGMSEDFPVAVALARRFVW